MQTLLTKSLVVSAVAGLCLIATPQAQASSGFRLSGPQGSVSLDPPNNEIASTPPASINVTFPGPFQLTELSGNFASITGAVIEAPLTFTLIAGYFPDRYSLSSFNITFTGAGNGITTLIVAPNSNYDRLGHSESSMIMSDSDVLLEAVDNNNLAYTGSFEAIDSTTDNGVFSLTFTAVPEPLTMMGASAAIAFGAAFKRRSANKG